MIYLCIFAQDPTTFFPGISTHLAVIRVLRQFYRVWPPIRTSWKKKSLAEKAKNTTPLSGDFVDLMAKRWHQVAKTTTQSDFFSDGTRSEESQESQVLIPTIHEEAATVDAQVHHTETLNDEDVVVSDPPVTKSCPALLPDKKWTILPVPMIAVIQLPTWWIWAPESFIQENSDRLLQFGSKPPLVPLVNGVPHFLHRSVRVKEKPRYLLGQKQCAICERIFCGHGKQCTRKNFSCKWCHFPHTEECFFSFKDKNKFILKTRGEGFCGTLTETNPPSFERWKREQKCLEGLGGCGHGIFQTKIPDTVWDSRSKTDMTGWKIP